MGLRRHPVTRKLASIMLAFLFLAETTVFAQVRLVTAARPVVTQARPPVKSPWTPPSTEAFAARMREALAERSHGVATTPTLAPTPPAPAAPPAPSSTERVSVSGSGGEGDRESSKPSVSSDGRYVAFESKARNLVPDDGNKKRDVFVRDRELGTTERVSVSSSGDEGDRESARPAISGDGRFVTFQSKSRTFYANDKSRGWNVFVHDRTLGTTIPVSVAPDGALGDHDSKNPSISGDGRFVAFASKARNLVPVAAGFTNDDDDSSDDDSSDDDTSDDSSSDDDAKGAKKRIYVLDRETSELSVVSISTLGVEADRDASDAAISADGRVVAFVSKADNLVAGDDAGRRDVFVHERETGETTRVSVAGDGAEADRHSHSPSISAGRYVAFVSKSTNLVPGDMTASEDVFVHDRETGETIRVSVSTGGVEGDLSSREPSVNATGRFVAFSSKARNLVDNDLNRRADVFVRDLAREITVRLSVASDGGEADKKSAEPAVSGDGSIVAFSSDARNLVVNDSNKKRDVFSREVGLNRAPNAVDDAATTFENDPVDIPVLSNDADPDGDPLSVTELVPGAGSVSVNPDGSVHYVPPAGFSGTDTFTYTIEDAHGGSDSATVTVEVRTVNQPPVVDAGADQTLQLPATNLVLTGSVTDDGLPQGAGLTITWTQMSGPSSVVFDPADAAVTTASPNFHRRTSVSVGSINIVCERPYLYCLHRTGIDPKQFESFVLQGCGASDPGEGHTTSFVFDPIFRDRSEIRKKRSETVDGQPIGSLLGRGLCLSGV